MVKRTTTRFHDKARRQHSASTRFPQRSKRPLRDSSVQVEQRAAENIIVGRHPVREALRSDAAVTAIWMQEGLREGSLQEVWGQARAKQIPVHLVPRMKLDEMAGDAAHQGVAAQISPQPLLDLEDLAPILQQSAHPLVLILDGIQDPHNFGAILRVADAAAVDAVVIPKRGAVGITPIVAKSSAGAVAYVPIVSVTNMAQAVERLQKMGLFIYAADPEAAVSYTAVDWTGAVGLIIGSEGTGIRPLVKAHADQLVTLPMHGHVASLNAATAAAVLTFEVLRQRG
ncbi:MAG: 23S rRNA (guanosine(2251)-2'-O)-methyltransferase RlmB [Firmicutes bacterium]|nr:23S rRNA (guanosine(2251)-2'-O)-methyltransferase RlmB [Bacillota bacterium]